MISLDVSHLLNNTFRLGMFGFLSTESAEAPGNYGMLDQVAALQWVKQNIEVSSISFKADAYSHL